MSEIRDVKPLPGVWTKRPLREVPARDNEKRHQQSRQEHRQNEDGQAGDNSHIDEYA